MIGAARLDLLEGRFRAALDAWDGHIERCTKCLRHGTALCQDGFYLSGDVIEARAALEAARGAAITAPPAPGRPGHAPTPILPA